MYSGSMPRTPAPKPDNPEQHKRFIDMAREVEVDEREGAFDGIFDLVKDKAKSPKSRHDLDESASDSSRNQDQSR